MLSLAVAAVRVGVNKGEEYGQRRGRLWQLGHPNNLCCSGIEFYEGEGGDKAAFAGGEKATAVTPGLTSGGLTVLAARYGWTDDLWGPSSCSHGAGVKDVTSIVQGDVRDGELHINPDCRGQYMNQVRGNQPKSSNGQPLTPRFASLVFASTSGPKPPVAPRSPGIFPFVTHTTAG